MDQLERLHGDLSFVRGALDASTRSKSSAPQHFMWALIVAIGFSLVDFRADLVPAYWTVAGPAGFLASAYLGWRRARRIGQASAGDGRRYLLHWGAVLVVIAMAILLGTNSGLPLGTLQTVILLLLALGYFTAGLHLDRALLWVGPVIAAGAVAVTVVPLYAWTAVGIALGLALAAAGLREGRSREANT